MTEVTSKFAGTSQFYSQYRPGVPAEVAERLAAEANRDAPATKLLDLGTGTGQVIEVIHPFFEDIIGVDPDAEMLDLARQNLESRVPQGKLRLLRSNAEDFTPPAGWSPSLVTICRAFHWIDQPVLLARLDEYTAPRGVVAVFGDRSFWKADNDWMQSVRRVVQDFLGEERRAGEGWFSHHNRPYSEILRESPFSDVEEFTIPVKRTWDVESILGYLYSTSFASQPLFGDRLGEFESAVRKALAEHGGPFEEENEFTVRLGRRARGNA